MARLAKCKDCGVQISSSAKACPQCGAPLRKTGFFSWLVLIIGLVVIFNNFISQKEKVVAVQSVANSEVIEKNRIEASKKRFEEDPETAINEIKEALASGNSNKALNLVRDYKGVVGNNALDEMHVKILYDKVKGVSAKDINENKDLYGQLVTLEPNNEVFKNKYKYYSNKVERYKTIQAQFMNGKHIALVASVKLSMKNPDSFEHVSTAWEDKGDNIYVKMTYRGTNSFNAVVIETVIAEFTWDGKFVRMVG
ncbi:putative Zinc ribbon domain-containing protein [uncultured Thiomicrorhabdus sp.]